MRSAAGDLCLHLEAEGQAFHPGQVVYLPLTIRGKNGVVESNADEAVTLTVKGGELLGFGSANPCTTDRFDAGRCTTYQGCALAVVRAGRRPAHRDGHRYIPAWCHPDFDHHLTTPSSQPVPCVVFYVPTFFYTHYDQRRKLCTPHNFRRCIMLFAWCVTVL